MWPSMYSLNSDLNKIKLQKHEPTRTYSGNVKQWIFKFRMNSFEEPDKRKISTFKPTI